MVPTSKFDWLSKLGQQIAFHWFKLRIYGNQVVNSGQVPEGSHIRFRKTSDRFHWHAQFAAIWRKKGGESTWGLGYASIRSSRAVKGRRARDSFSFPTSNELYGSIQPAMSITWVLVTVSVTNNDGSSISRLAAWIQILCLLHRNRGWDGLKMTPFLQLAKLVTKQKA